MTDTDQDAKKQAQERAASPKPAMPKAKDKPKFGAPTTKAQHAAARRADKTVVKRMRKR